MKTMKNPINFRWRNMTRGFKTVTVMEHKKHNFTVYRKGIDKWFVEYFHGEEKRAMDKGEAYPSKVDACNACEAFVTNQGAKK